MSGKKVLIGVLALCFLCCCAMSLFMLLFGKFESNGECTYKGPFAQEGGDVAPACDEDSDSDDEEESNNDVGDLEPLDENDDNPQENDFGLDVFSNEHYALEYPLDWYTEVDGDNIYVYRFDPNDIPAGQTNDNFNVQSIIGNNEQSSFTKSDCQDLADGVAEQLIGTYDEINVVSTQVTTLNDNKTCKVVMDGSLKGIELDLYQYYIIDGEDDSNAFVLTFGMEKDSEHFDALIEIAESFSTL